MPDLLDEAKKAEMDYRQAALAEVLRARTEPPQQIVDGVVLCIDCDEPVEPRRLDAKPNAARCITCQRNKELFRHGRR